MTLTDTAGLDTRTLEWRLVREEQDAYEAAQADAADAYEDARRELLPRRKRTYTA